MSPSGQSDLLTFDIRGALWRYPFPILAAALLTLWLLAESTAFPIWLTAELDSLGWSTTARDIRRYVTLMLGAAFLTATAAGFAAHRRSRQTSWALQGAAFLCGLAAAALFTNDGGFRLLLALICAVSLGAGVAAGRGSSGFWLANARLTTVLAAGVCAAGLATIGGKIVFNATEILLGIDEWTIDRDSLGFIWTFALPVLWLSLARFDRDETLDGHGISVPHPGDCYGRSPHPVGAGFWRRDPCLCRSYRLGRRAAQEARTAGSRRSIWRSETGSICWPRGARSIYPA